jgi:hypothetical protein
MFGPLAKCWPLGQNFDVFDKNLGPFERIPRFFRQHANLPANLQADLPAPSKKRRANLTKLNNLTKLDG